MTDPATGSVIGYASFSGRNTQLTFRGSWSRFANSRTPTAAPGSQLLEGLKHHRHHNTTGASTPTIMHTNNGGGNQGKRSTNSSSLSAHQRTASLMTVSKRSVYPRHSKFLSTTTEQQNQLVTCKARPLLTKIVHRKSKPAFHFSLQSSTDKTVHLILLCTRKLRTCRRSRLT